MKARTLIKLGRRGIKYHLRDSFDTNIAAGSLNNTLATDGRNVRLVSDTESKLSTASGSLLFGGGKASPAIGNPGLKYASTFPRKEGLTLDFAIKSSGSTQGSIGLHNSATPTFTLKAGVRFLNAKFYDAVSSADLVTRSWSNAYKICRVVIHTVGYDIYTSEDGGLSFFHEIQNTTDTTNPITMHAAGYNLAGEVAWIDVTSRPRGPFYGQFIDDFDRPDTTATAGTAGTVGSLGQTAQGFPWMISGSNLPYISDKHYVVAHNASNAGYAYLNFPTTVMPHTMRAKVKWYSAGGAGDEALVVLIAGTAPLTDMVHCIVNRDSFNITVWDNADGGSHHGVGGVSFPLCELDTEYQIGMRVSGNTVTFEAPDGNEYSYTDAMIGTHWGRNLCYELTSPVDGSVMPKIKETAVQW